MIAMITLPAEIRFVSLASLMALRVAEIFSESLIAKGSYEDFCDAFELSISEAFTNSVKYAVRPDKDTMITLSFSADNNKLTASISDTNPPFSLDTPAQDITTYPVNGFGLLLIRQLMDNVSYIRENGKNLISMTKEAENSQNQIL